MLTGIFGGSFNPIHNGHINLAQEVLSQGLAEEVWLMVTPRNPLKQQSELAEEQTRLQMARKAVEGIDGIRVTDFEFHLPRPSYTWDTLQALGKAFPERTFALIIGSDNWAVFHRWAHATDLLRRYTIIIYPRTDYPVGKSLPANVKLLQAPLFAVSSTDIRRRVARGEDISGLVPAGILDEVNTIYGRKHAGER